VVLHFKRKKNFTEHAAMASNRRDHDGENGKSRTMQFRKDFPEEAEAAMKAERSNR
jgi:hypothetical protein